MNGAIIRDILRVDHAGEHGAIRIYRAQIAAARRIAPDIVPQLEEALADERRHCATFETALRKRGERSCNLLSLWGVGGTVLGFSTALLGREAILVCTEAVERTVHRHMDEQVAWLASREAGLATVIGAIREEEVAHLDRAGGARSGSSTTWLRALDRIVAAATELLVWVSTYGASSQLRGKLRNH